MPQTIKRLCRALVLLILVTQVSQAASGSFLLDLSLAEQENRDQLLASFLENATPADIPVLLELARDPSLCASRIGEVGQALKRLGHDIPWDKIEPLLSQPQPASRLLGMAALQTLSETDQQARAIGLLQADFADVRSRAALLLRHHPSPETFTALQARLVLAEAPAERLALQATMDWLVWLRSDKTDQPAPAILEVLHAPPASAQAWSAFYVPGSSAALEDAAWAELVTAGVRQGATLWLNTTITGKWPAGAEKLLADLELTLPAIDNHARTLYRDNLDEPSPLESYIHDVAMHQVLPPTEAADQLAPIISRLGEWFPQASRGFRQWDSSAYAAPFIGLQQPGLAPLLIAPRRGDRGRIILDTSDIRLPPDRRRGEITTSRSITWRPYDLETASLRLWEIGNNLQALVQGLAAVIPLKQITNKTGVMQKPDELIPAPYFDVDTRIVTPHIPWAKPLNSAPVKAGFLLPEELIRSGIEVQQRLSLETTWIPWSEHYFFSKDTRNEKRRMDEIIDAGSTLQLFKALQSDHEVIIMPGLSGMHERMNYHMCWDGLLPDTQALLLNRVRHGLGLVVLGPTWVANPAAFGAMEIPVPDAILAAFPLPAPAVACYKLGKGRIVHVKLTHFMGWAEVDLGRDFLAPGLASPMTRRLKQDEYAYSLDCAAILWAAGRETRLSGEQAETVLADRFGRRAPPGQVWSAAIRETRYLNAAGEVNGWRTERLPSPTTPAPTIAFSQRVLEPASPLEFSIAMPRLRPTDAIQVIVTDALGRQVLPTRTFTGAEVAAGPIVLPGWIPLRRWHDAYVQIRRNDELIGDAMLPFAVNVPHHPNDLRTILFPGPTPFAEGLIAAGVDAVARNRFHAQMPKNENLLETELADVRQWDSFDFLLRYGIEPFGGSVGRPNTDVSGPHARYQPSLHSPTFHQSMRDQVAAWAEPHRLLGWPSVETVEEFVGPSSIGFSAESLVVFRRELRQRYSTLDALNAAWKRNFATWDEVMPDTLEEAMARRNLVSWTQHHAFMERAIANWQAMGEQYYRQVQPNGSLSFWTPQFDSPFGLADVTLISRACSSHFFYAGRDTVHLADMRAPGGELGIWYPFCYDRDLAWSAQLEARQLPHSYLLQRFNTYGIWWGFEKFQWPYLRPDFTPCRNFAPLAEEIPQLQDGIDRIVLGARKDDQGIAVIFDQNSFRTTAALNKMNGSRLKHDWPAAMDLVSVLHVEPTIVPLGDVRFGRLTNDTFRVAFLFGVACLNDEDAAAIRQFVEQGGTVVADVMPGLYNADAMERTTSPVADLFGSTATLPDGAFNWGEKDIGEGKVLLLNGQVPADPEQRFAWGRAVTGWLQLRPSPQIDLGAPLRGREAYRFTDGDRQLIGITFGLGAYDRTPPPFTASLTTESPKVLYTLQADRPPETGTHFEIPVPQWQAAYLLLTDTPLPPLSCTAGLGSNRTISLSLASTMPGCRIAVIQVSGPGARPHAELRREVEFDGTGQVQIPIAWSEAGGTWQLTIIDCLTRQHQQLEIAVP